MSPHPAVVALLMVLSCAACSKPDAAAASREAPRERTPSEVTTHDAGATMARPSVAPSNDADTVSSNRQARTSAR